MLCGTVSPLGKCGKTARWFAVALLTLVLSITAGTSTNVALASVEAPRDVPVTVTQGPTPIVNGSCVASDDITVRNGFLAISIANTSVPPWGVPNGSILDAAPIVDGKIQQDRITLVDFLPNAWAAWPNTYHNVSIVENSPDKASVKVERDYKEVRLTTIYELEKGSDTVHLLTTMENTGPETYDIYSGYSLCTSGGYMFGPYKAVKNEGEEYYSAPDEFGKYVVGYDEDWAIGLHYPEGQYHDGGTGWKDLYHRHTMKPGDTFTAEAWLQFEPQGNIAPLLSKAAALAGKSASMGSLQGKVSYAESGKVSAPVIIVEKDGETFTWCLGKDGPYSLSLPEGRYTVYAIAKNCAPSTKYDLTVAASARLAQDFDDVRPGGELTLRASDETGKPVHARIKVTGGTEPVVRFLGANTFFTGLGSQAGTARFTLAPGTYTLVLDSGAGFVSKNVEIPITVDPGKKLESAVSIKTLLNPARAGWYSADQHHHSDILDGITPPEYLVESQLAARLDLTLVSDHDSVTNHVAIKSLSDGAGVPFLPAVEVSPNWGHFVMLGVPLGKANIDPSGTPSQIFQQAAQCGAVIAVAHPYITYGYFYNNEKGDIHGQYDEGFDLIELQSTAVTKKGNSADELTLKNNPFPFSRRQFQR